MTLSGSERAALSARIQTAIHDANKLMLCNCAPATAAVLPVVEQFYTDHDNSATGAVLRLAASGRRTYAERAPFETAALLLAEAATFEQAARIAEGDTDSLKGALPSWRWNEISFPDERRSSAARVCTMCWFNEHEHCNGCPCRNEQHTALSVAAEPKETTT